MQNENICALCGTHWDDHSIKGEFCLVGDTFSNHQRFKSSVGESEPELTRLRAENARLRKALEPFARLCPFPYMDKTVPNSTKVTWSNECWVGPSQWNEFWKPATVGDCRAAKAALEGER